MRKELIAQRDPKAPVSEVFRTLRTNIQFMNTDKKLKTLLVTSTFPGEGKSWVSSNLAVTFAQSGKKVILIDADMRKGRLFNIFGVSPRPGLSNYLSGMDERNAETSNDDVIDYIQETEVRNLYVMTAGNVPPNPSELLVSERMMKLLKKLKDMCDLVVIDGTPSELVTDSVILSRIVDSTIIVSAYKQTKKENLKRIAQNIKNVGGKIAGVVVNKVPITAKKYSESYYYGSTQGGSSKSSKGKTSKSKASSSRTMHHSSTVKEDVNKTQVRPVKRDVKAPEVDMNKMKQAIKPTQEEPKVGNTIPQNKMDFDLNASLKNSIKMDVEHEEKPQVNEVNSERAQDILKQINDYLATEKKNLKNGE